MAKPGKQTLPSATPPGAPWLTYFLVAVASSGIGAVGMRVALQPQLEAAARPTAPMPAPAPASARPGPVPEPPAEIVAGKSPAQAARAVGNYFYDHGDWLRAQQSYAAAIREGNDDADIRTDYANTFHFTGRLDEAIEQYRIAQRLDARHEASRFNLGVLYADAKREPAQAIAVWEEFIRLFPTSERAVAARDAITRLRANPPTPALAENPTPTPTGAPVTSDADLRRMLQHLEPAPAGATPPK